MELATPITIYWDIPTDSLNAGAIQRICSDIRDCSPLMLQLYFGSTVLSGDGLSIILEQFKSSRIAVSLTIPAAALETAPRDYLQGIDLKELLLYTDSLDVLAAALFTVKTFSGPAVGVSFSVTRENWRQLPELVELCRRVGVSRLVLPMQRLYNNETPFFITAHEQQELANHLSQIGGIKDLSLTIHDPFLWRTFNPDIPFPQAGCQAANTMIAISPDGGVFPCPTLPVRLASIGQKSLKEIILSTEKKEFRRRLLTPPGDCGDCAEILICRGGCRGRGLVLEGSLNGIDKACR